MRIIGSQKNLATPFLHFFIQLLHYTAKPLLIPTYTRSYPQHENNLKIIAHYANVCVTIGSKFRH
ncbi:MULTISPECIES: hypothetical protein [Providencia]|uniref:hypothetical protein n=1 Tax=Providencia TaxID=586 RepID=UPI000D8D9D27|nr:MULTISPECIES: hypothetical protein [Providencia]PYZ52045.1 hypothetical protein DNK63_18860 [Providencia rettgeri]